MFRALIKTSIAVSFVALSLSSHGKDYENKKFPDSVVNSEKSARQAQIARQKVAERHASREKGKQERGAHSARTFSTESRGFKKGAAHKKVK